MEECNNRGEGFQANSTIHFSPRSGNSLISTLSGRSTPQNSPTFQRLHSSFTPRREGRGGAKWFGSKSNRLLRWLLLITLWAYLVFFVQSRWAHGDKEEELSGFGRKPSDFEQNQHQDLISKNKSLSVNNETVENKVRIVGDTLIVALAKKESDVSSQRKISTKKRRSTQSRNGLRGKRRRPKVEKELESEIPLRNTTYGFLVGPFGSTEDRILQWGPEKRFGTCERNGEFARLVRSRRFVLVFHELSMTGAPLSMMELATELLSCGATVSAVVLSKKGGLMQELVRRQIKVIDDKANRSFRTAMKADLVIAGSAVCASWIGQYIEHSSSGTSHVVWWIMENRREYFERSKNVLQKVKMLVFLSESQSKQWQKWCEEEKLELRSQLSVVPLSVNDELASVAGIHSALNGSSFSAAKMDEKRKLLRDSVRREMGLNDKDMLVLSLSSINPGKGQLLLLESANSIIEHGPLQNDKKMQKSADVGEHSSTLIRKHNVRKLLPLLEDTRRRVWTRNNGTMVQSLKILIGSVGSKSNKVDYVKGLLSFLEQHSNLSKEVLWTPATTSVASLYSAADVYIINSQGLGETFGRVTIEAMAFGLPVLGTDAGGTQEIVEHNVTGLLHPIGRLGNRFLARNLRFLLENRLAREQMGMNGRKKVQRKYLKQRMYEKFAEVLIRCIRSK